MPSRSRSRSSVSPSPGRARRADGNPAGQTTGRSRPPSRSIRTTSRARASRSPGRGRFDRGLRHREPAGRGLGGDFVELRGIVYDGPHGTSPIDGEPAVNPAGPGIDLGVRRITQRLEDPRDVPYGPRRASGDSRGSCRGRRVVLGTRSGTTVSSGYRRRSTTSGLVARIEVADGAPFDLSIRIDDDTTLRDDHPGGASRRRASRVVGAPSSSGRTRRSAGSVRTWTRIPVPPRSSVAWKSVTRPPG